MTAERTDEYWADLVREQCRLPAETEWVEFKHNQDNPKNKTAGKNNALQGF